MHFTGLKVISVLLVSLLVAEPEKNTAFQTPSIRIEAEGWGDALTVDIKKVLESAGRELLKRIPPDKPIRIFVVASKTVPQVDFKRTEEGEFIVRLAVRDSYWAQYAYQFSHEMGHIVCHYERRNDNKIGSENLWFEETVAETASLFVLTRMAETWKTNPPYNNWKSFAPALDDYVKKIIREVGVPTVNKMPSWFKDNQTALRADGHLRERNKIVAIHLFKMMEKNPSYWEAFRYLNLGRPDATNSFESYVENWYYSVPNDYKPFVKEVADLLGLKSTLIKNHSEK